MAKPVLIDDNGGREPALTCGIPVVTFPADAGYDVKLQRATDAAFTANLLTVVIPAEQLLYFDTLPNDNVTRYYRAAHTGRSEADSGWTATVTGVPALFTLAARDRLEQLAAEARRRNDTLYGQDGQVAPGTTVGEGTGGKSFLRNYQNGTTTDGATVTFPVGYQGVPSIRLSGGISYQPDGTKWSGGLTATAPQYDDFAATSPTATNFVARAKLRQYGARTTVTKDFQNVTRTAVGDTDVATLTAAGATDESYELRFKCSVTATTAPGTPGSATLVVAFDTNDGSGYVERARRSYVVNTAGGVTTQNFNTELITISAPSLGNTDTIRIRVVSLDFSEGAIGAFTLHGFTAGVDGTAGVTYYTSTDSTASKTPTAGDTVAWEAWEYAN
jgi:hypothetical protein